MEEERDRADRLESDYMRSRPDIDEMSREEVARERSKVSVLRKELQETTEDLIDAVAVPQSFGHTSMLWYVYQFLS